MKGPTRPEKPRLVLVMVGLPARGKTYTAQKLARYLSWLGHTTRVFNVGNYRRARVGPQQRHEFFDPNNPVGAEARRKLAMTALDDLLHWMRQSGQVAIYDATNSSRERRSTVRKRCEQEGLQVLFIESVCEDPAIIDANVRQTKLSSPDYVDVDPAEAVRDFRARIAHYEAAYEEAQSDEGSFIKLIDVGRQIVAHDIHGYLPARLVFFLLNIHIKNRQIWLTRHGESTFNQSGLIGGDPDLSDRGRQYALALRERLDALFPKPDDIVIWTSTLRRTVQTAEVIGRPFMRWRALDEIDAGVCDSLTYEQIRQSMPQDYAARQADKLNYRYPRGESYQDVIVRLEPVIIELERQQTPVLVIAHQAVVRALYAYFMDYPPEQCPFLRIPLHSVIELTPRAYGCEEQVVRLEPRIET